ncbi:MAG: plasmid maintenance system killer [Methylomonas sp.]|nr:MAG: plasmid maintenance system killer [Methylomonas sp.]
MIKTFANKETAAVFARKPVRRFGADLQRLALIKLALLHRAVDVNDLRIPPGNRLEKLSGDRADQYSIRINGQWRLCFRFENGDAFDVEIVDYH